MGLLPHLQNLQIEGNSLKQIRMDVIKGGTNRILKHLREKMEDVKIKDVPRASDKSVVSDAFPNKFVADNFCQAHNNHNFTSGIKCVIQGLLV